MYLNKYDISYMLLRKDTIQAVREKQEAEKKTEKFLLEYPWLSFAFDTKTNNLYQELLDRNWGVAYEDDVAVILKRP